MHSRRLSCKFLIWVALSIPPSDSILFAQTRSVNLELQVIKRENYQFFPRDLNSDGVDEIIMDTGSSIHITNETGTTMYASFAKKGAYYVPMHPIATGRLDYFLFFHQTTSDGMIDLNLWEINLNQQKKEKVYKKIWAIEGKDLDGDGLIYLQYRSWGNIAFPDGRIYAILSIGSGSDRIYRGICAFDIQAKRFAWRYGLGPQIVNVKLKDLTGDGIPEILLSTYAPDNYASWNGFADDSSYVFAFAANGSLMWSQGLGGMFTGANAEINDFNGDGKLEIFAYRYSLAQSNESHDIIVRLDPKTGKVLEKKSIGGFIVPYRIFGYRSHLSADINEDGQAELVVGCTDGFIRAYNGDLLPVEISSLYKSPPTVIGIAYLTGDGEPFVVSKTENNMLHVLDGQLQSIFHYQLPGANTQVMITKGRYRDRLQFSYSYQIESGHIHISELVEFRRKPVIVQTYERMSWLFWSIAAFVVLVVGFMFIRQSYWKHFAIRFLIGISKQINFWHRFLIIDRKGRVIEMGSQWQQLLDVEHNAGQRRTFHDIAAGRFDTLAHALQSLLEQRQRNAEVNLSRRDGKELHVRLVAYPILPLKCTVILLHDLSEEERFRRFKSWAKVSQRVAHEIKTPLTTIKLNAEELKDILTSESLPNTAEKQEYLDDIIIQADRLTKMSDRFMRFLQLEQLDIKPTDVNELIQDLIAQWLPERHKGLHVDFELQPDVPPAMLDEKQFSFILQTLFFNALDSVGEKGRILIRTALVEYFSDDSPELIESFVEIQIHDTGRSVPQSVLDKLGEPFLTTKESGTGLGLMLVMRLMEEHRGMFLLENIPGGKGAVATLRFRVSR